MAAPMAVEPQELASKPLVEAIFELRWSLAKGDDPSLRRDPGFKVLLGRFFDRVHAIYPVMIDLPAAQIPEDMIPNVVRHQFRAGPTSWPLLQLGPGILTANETAGYSWATFKPRLKEAIAALFDSYPRDLHGFRPNQVVLRYMNAIPLNPLETPLLPFLRAKLHTEISLDPILGETVLSLEQPLGLTLNLSVPMRVPVGVCGLSFSTGRAGDKPALIWQIDAQARDGDVPADQASFETWLESAHAVIEKWFFTLSRGELLESFKG